MKYGKFFKYVTGQTKELINEIEKYYNVSDLRFLTRQQWDEIFDGKIFKLNDEFLMIFEKFINAEKLGQNIKLSSYFILKGIDNADEKLTWQTIIDNYPDLFFKLFDVYKRMNNLTKTMQIYNLPENVLDGYIEYFNVKYLLSYQKLSEEFLEKNLKHLIKNFPVDYRSYERKTNKQKVWEYISQYQKLNEPFIERHAGEVDWKLISRYQEISEEFIEKHSDEIEWKELGINTRLSENFIDKYADKLDWWNISRYQALSEPFMEKNADKLDWDQISGYQKISFNFIKKHLDRITSRIKENPYIDLKNIMDNIDKNPEWFDVILILKEKDIDKGEKDYFGISRMNRKLNTQKFWKNYIEYLKTENENPSVVKYKFISVVQRALKCTGLDKKRLINNIKKAVNTTEYKDIQF